VGDDVTESAQGNNWRGNPAVLEGVRLVLEEGLTQAEAARRVGVGHSAISKRLRPDAMRRYNSGQESTRKRRWDEEHRLPCSVCGQPMTGGSARTTGGTTSRVRGDVCRACRTQRRVEHVLAAVRLRIEHEETNETIAKRLGVSPLTVRTEFVRLRAMGYWVPLSGRLRNAAQRAQCLDEEGRALQQALEARGYRPPMLTLDRTAAA
jgi:hypothetical protein